MKMGILGARISGLSVGEMLSENHEVEILKRKEVYGGGHCFYSKFDNVIDFFFNNILQKNDRHIIQCNANIKLQGNEISHSIEYAIKDVSAINITTTVAVKDNLKKIGVNILGRFGEWQYYNTNVCIKQNIELAKKIETLAGNTYEP